MKRAMLVGLVAAGLMLSGIPLGAQGGTPPSTGGANPPSNSNPPLFKGDRREKNAKERALVGTVTDAKEVPIEGAVVQLKDAKTLAVRSFLTKHDGKFQFQGLSLENDYEVKAERNGQVSQTRTLSVYDTRKEPILNLKIE